MRDARQSMTLDEIKEERASRARFRQMKREIKEARGARLRVYHASCEGVPLHHGLY